MPFPSGLGTRIPHKFRYNLRKFKNDVPAQNRRKTVICKIL